jgi:hypothetical protein
MPRIGLRRSDTIERVVKRRAQARIGDTEVHKSNLAGDEGANRARTANLKFGTEQTSKGAELGAHYSPVPGGAARVNIDETPLEIVTHFRFQHDVGMNIETDPGPQLRPDWPQGWSRQSEGNRRKLLPLRGCKYLVPSRSRALPDKT